MIKSEGATVIPHKIQLKNFLSYGSQIQTIDFTHYDLICLSGKNGHGKSALLDAMTWALWGQARKVLGTAKADAGLLRLGQTQMLVIFDFELGGKMYRIRREYMETFNKPLSALEFGIIDPETQEFIPLTDKTIRATQEKIEQTLRLDFDAFTNSAFLRQGNSNEFSKKSPKDRKQILAAILGLDQYEVIRKKALEKIKETTTKKAALTMLQEKRLQDLTHQENLNAELLNLDQQMSSLIKQEKQWNTNYSHLTENKKNLESELNKRSILDFQKAELTKNYTAQLEQLKLLRNEWRTINRKKNSYNSPEHLEQQKKEIVQSIAKQQKLFQKNLEYKEQLLNITQSINSIEQAYKDKHARKQQALLIEVERLVGEQKNKTTIITMIEDEIKKHAAEHAIITQQIEALNKEIAQLILPTTEQITQMEQHIEKRKMAYQQFVAQGNWMNTELANLLQKKKLVHEDDPSCPLCEQNLSASRKRFLKANFDAMESFLSHRLRRLKRIIPALKEILVAQHTQLSGNKERIQKAQTNKAKIKELLESQQKLTALSTQLTEKQLHIQQEVETLTKTIQELNDNITQQAQSTLVITNNDEYQKLIQEKNNIESELSKHSYNTQQYAEQQEQLKIIELQLNDYELFKKDTTLQENRAYEIHKFCNTLKAIKREVAQLQTQIDNFATIEEKITTLQKEEKNLQEEHNVLLQQKEMLLQTKGRLESQQKQLNKVKIDYETEQKNITAYDTIIDDYQAISLATGKDGIQALLIEEAIPEIEQEANLLLSQLTNNQAQVFIESLRDLKKGGTKETLDIKISDQNGIRPYEMFSGGEAFRIDFALRIAISKLLARRAGTALQTLIIDEGFGSQDEEGLGHIMDALHAIQSNFSKIIVVSHLPTMKDQFPVQFVIQKGVQGSTVTVIEQG